MDMRSNTFDHKGSSRCWGCFGCRRRSLSNKLMPIFLQIVIVFVVWFVVKKSCSASGQDGVTVRRIKSVDGQGVSLCNDGDYVKGTALRIEDIVSFSGSQEQKQFFLEVDILTRDVEQGSPILYTVGTPVIVDGVLKDYDTDFEKEEEEEKEEGAPQEDKSEFYYDNSLEAQDADDPNVRPGENSEYETGEDKEDEKEEDDEEKSESEKQNDFPEEEDNTPSDNSNNPNNQIGNGGQIIANINLDTSNVDNRGQLQSGINGRFGIQQHQQQLQGQNQFFQENLPHQNGIRIAESGMQNQQQQKEFGVQYNPPQENQINVQNGQNLNRLRTGGNPIPQDGSLNFPRGGQENKIAFGVQQRPNNLAAGDTSIADKINQQAQNIPAENNALFKMGQGQESTSGRNNIPYSEGFKERLTRFKTEFYGRPVDESSGQTPTTYMMNNPTLCQHLPDIDVLFVVHTIPQSDDQRQRIRDTFAKASLFQPFKIAHVFIVGQTTSPNFQGNLDKEQQQYKDIVQGGFMDTAEARSNKGLMGMQWVKSFCRQARFVMKIDEDVFVDTDKLLLGLIPATTNVIGPKSILCFLVENASIPRSGPNALNPNVFPNTSKMRPFCKGFAVLMTASTIDCLVTASEHVTIFQFDDLYLYGILPFVAGGIKVYDLGNQRAFHNFGMEVVNCYKDPGDSCPYVATKAFSSRFTSLWEYVAARRVPGANRYQASPSLWNIADYQRSFYS